MEHYGGPLDGLLVQGDCPFRVLVCVYCGPYVLYPLHHAASEPYGYWHLYVRSVRGWEWFGIKDTKFCKELESCRKGE